MILVFFGRDRLRFLGEDSDVREFLFCVELGKWVGSFRKKKYFYRRKYFYLFLRCFVKRLIKIVLRF